MFERLELENFTVFGKASFEWAAGINVLVGANGTGKTHLLKLLYCLQTSGHDEQHLMQKLNRVFSSSQRGRINYLVRDEGLLDKKSSIEAIYGDSTLTLVFPVVGGINVTPSDAWMPEYQAVYVPAKEVLSFAPGFLQLYDRFNLAFDEVYRDIIDLAYTPHQKEILQESQPVLDVLQQVIGGMVSVEGDAFLLGSRTMHLVAEGHRKLALIWQLIRNGSIASGNTLFWDEPEANLNPIMMQDVVKVLLMLAQNGVQIFVATHSDAFMRELDYQKGNLATRFFALEKTDQGVVPHPAERYIDVKPNPIEDEYVRLYDLEVRRSLGLL
jgi:ABC-type lipoprotein export system ATPase subunit